MKFPNQALMSTLSFFISMIKQYSLLVYTNFTKPVRPTIAVFWANYLINVCIAFYQQFIHILFQILQRFGWLWCTNICISSKQLFRFLCCDAKGTLNRMSRSIQTLEFCVQNWKTLEWCYTNLRDDDTNSLLFDKPLKLCCETTNIFYEERLWHCNCTLMRTEIDNDGWTIFMLSY